MNRKTRSVIALVLLGLAAVSVWAWRMGYLSNPMFASQIPYPSSFQAGSGNSLDIRSLVPEPPLPPQARRELQACNEILEQDPDDPDALQDAFWVLFSNRLKASSVPYGERYLAIEKHAHPDFLKAYTFALSRAARFEAAWNAHRALAEAQPGFARQRISAKYVHFHQCLHACRVLKDPVVAGRAFAQLVRIDPDVPFLELYDSSKTLFMDLLTERFDKSPLPKELDDVWVYLPSTDMKVLAGLYEGAGGTPSEAMLAATDDFNMGRVAPPAAKAQRAMHAYCRRQYKIDLAMELTKQAVADARQLGDRGELLEALWRQAAFAHIKGVLEVEYSANTEADRIAQELQIPGWIARTKAKLGLMYEKFGDYARAFDAYDESIALNMKYQAIPILYEDPKALRARLVSLAGNPSEAEPELRRFAEHAERIAPGPGLRCIPYFNLGICLSRLGQREEAIKAFSRSAEGSDLDYRGSSMIEIGRLEFARQNYEEAEKAFDKAARCETRISSAERRWAWQFGKAQIRRARKDLKGAEEWLTKTLKTIESQRASLKDYAQRRTLLNNKYQAYEFGVEMALEGDDQTKAFAFAERSRARTFLDALGVKAEASRPVTLASLADLQSVSPQFATIVFWSQSKQLLVWIVRKEGMEQVTIPLSRNTVQGMLTSFYRETISQKAAANWVPRLRTLWTHLWAPIENKLSPNERVCIIPHHVLHYVPFQALHDGKQFVVERHTVFYAPSGSGLVELRNLPAIDNNAIAVFDAALENDPKSVFSKTPTAMLRKRFPKASFFVQTEATEEAFRTAGPAGLIHVTAHGSYDAWIPLRSGLHLHASGDDDGVLRAEEISRLDASSTSLLVLCSCVSSVGDLANGDEVTGVTRAFQMAGVRNVIGSLWPVEVTATNHLMELFYEELEEKRNDPAQALCEAQRRFLKENPHPYRWSGFQVNGSGGRLARNE